MRSFSYSNRRLRIWTVLLVVSAAVAGLPLLQVVAQQPTTLHIGTTGTLSSSKETDEASALKTLQNFIKEETGLTNDILTQKGWQQLADKMAKGELQIGVYQGFEFAWAQEKQPKLKPIALAVNTYTYPVAYIVAGKKANLTTFAALKGHTIAIPDGSPGFLHLFLNHECQPSGKKAESYFSKIEASESAEEALDDCVDGKVDAVVADRPTLESFKRRKPTRFSQLRPVVHSEQFPPAVIAYYEGKLDQATRQRFEKGLLDANQSDRGQTILTLFHLTGFDRVPDSFEQVLTATRKTYPPSTGQQTARTK